MIIKHPTGFYKTILSKIAKDGTNITFLISNNSPPKAELSSPKYSKGLSRRAIPERTMNSTRRKTQGELIYSISSSKKVQEGNSARKFETGQFIEFVAVVQSQPIVELMLQPNKTETRHNTNFFDYDEFSLTQEDVDVLSDESSKLQSRLSDALNDLIRQRSITEVRISDSQKIYNDSNKNLSAVETIIKNLDSFNQEIDTIYKKFIASKVISGSNIRYFVKLANQLSLEVKSINEQLSKIITVVK